MGDSIMDQQGSAAAFLLRQLGYDARADGEWGSGLFTREQYDFGRTITAPPPAGAPFDWLVEARKLVESEHPDLFVVYLNHNHFPPLPRDAQGNDIADLRSPAGRAMIATQATALIDILRSSGARVAFVNPAPLTTADPAADNAIWAGYLPVLNAKAVPVIDIRSAISGRNGGYTDTRPDCRGDQEAVRAPDHLHLSRFGAGLAGTQLAAAVAGMLGGSLTGSAAPGDHATTLVPTADGRGYWLIGCDGSIAHFGDATSLPGHADEPHAAVIGAVRTVSEGLWLVTANGDILRAGNAAALAFDRHATGPLVAAAGTADGKGIVAVTAAGDVVVAGTVQRAGSAQGLDAPVAGVATAPHGAGYWMVTTRGTVLAFGKANTFGAPQLRDGDAPVVGITANRAGDGYWIASADGSIRAYGGAAALGDAREKSGSEAMRPSGPTVSIVSSSEGYWLVDDNGAVWGRGAPELGGTSNLAFATA